MSIKLYKSQLTPTAGDSNVADTRQINLGEAQSIGKAMKGMLQSGEKLYIKHLDIKSDNELIEKTKEIMNGTDTKEGSDGTDAKEESSDVNVLVDGSNGGDDTAKSSDDASSS